MEFCVTTSDELQGVREQMNTMSLMILQNKQDTVRNKKKGRCIVKYDLFVI